MPPVPHNASCPGRSGTTGQPVSISAQAQRGAGCHTSALPGTRCIRASSMGSCNGPDSRASSMGSPTRTTLCLPEPAVRRLPVQAAPRERRRALSWPDRLGPPPLPAAAARRLREVADSATLDPVLKLLGRRREAVIRPLEDSDSRPDGENPFGGSPPPLAAARIETRSTSATHWRTEGSGRHSRGGGVQMPRPCLLSGRGSCAVPRSHWPGRGARSLWRERRLRGPRASRRRQ